jgi:selT/selW/selH selenoprotein domain
MPTDIKIVYCKPCGFLPRALNLAEEILKYMNDVNVTQTPGANGIFDVYVNGQLKFSRYQTKRFPEPNEIVEAASHIA